ncbi:uncharacterized protein LOC123192884 [Mangifera indica]|uniref:uncharacterized protein LOC123192884 n=1 Tax=Mangifera indica TaxID=29780 RepID=UPI001CFB4C34|nr:uncharacterized protein LOC123192884 [Mangifera indica]
MAKAGALICLLIVSVDVVAGTFGIKAEINSNKVTHTRLRGSSSSACKGPSHEAFKSGLVAATLQAIAHIAVNLLWGCMCMCFSEELERSAFNLRLWFACLILSWIVVAIGFPMLVIGMLANSKSEGSCGITHSHFLLIGGVLCFAHGLCCIAQYVSAPVTIGHEATNNVYP